MNFLRLCAEHLHREYAHQMDKICIILPTRRSGLVLQQYFKELKIKALPEITDIELWVAQLTGMENTNPVLLLLELYEVFSEVDKKTKLEKFTGWGYILLKDFDQIDRNLIDAEKLFQNLCDIKNLERWKLGEERITPKVGEYFQLWENLGYTYQTFRERLSSQNQAYSGMMYRQLAENAEQILLHQSPFEKYIFIGFNALSQAEEKIFKTLIDHQKAEVIWDADEYYMQDHTENKAGWFLKKYKHHWASTNWKFQSEYLQKSEKEITVIQVANASMQGKVVNQLLKNWSLTPPSPPLTGGEQVFPPSEGAGGRLSGDFADLMMPDTGIVLADEQILMTVLHSLDEPFANLNITIGLSLKDSAIFNLIDTLFEQYQTLIRDKETDQVKFSHRTIIRLLSHPFIRQFERRHTASLYAHLANELNENKEIVDNQGVIENESSQELETESELVETLLEDLPLANDKTPLTETKSLVLLLVQFINRNNLIFLGKEEIMTLIESDLFQEKIAEEPGLAEYCRQANEILKPLFEVLFARWKGTYDLIDALDEIIKLLYNEENYFESAYFQEFDKILKQLKYFVGHKPEYIDIRTFKIFLYQAFREAKFEFEGNKETPLQLMGINETRNLDFDNLIMLSVNETALPRSKKMSSFIPIDVAQSYGIPTYQEQDAIVSYHFYRLLQRAKNVALVYVAPSDTYGGKEKSRFILQLQSDLVRINPKIKIKELSARFRPQTEIEDQPLKFAKGENEIQKIKDNFLKGLTPSHINSFVTCSLQYYFGQIAEIGRTVAVEETLGADKIGSLIHEILEEIYRELAQENKFIAAEDIEKSIPSVQTRVEEKFNLDKYVNYVITGQNFIAQKVTTQFIERFLHRQMEEIADNNAPFEILTLENHEADDDSENLKLNLFADLEVMIQDEKVPILLKGVTDRIDKVKDLVRIVDYKTAKVEGKQVKLGKQDIRKLVSDRQLDKVRQLWLYKYIVAKRVMESKGKGFKVGDYQILENEPISAGIYSLRNLGEGFIEIKSGDKDTSAFPETLKEFVKESENYLKEIAENMLDPAQPFQKTEDIDACKYCNYKDICGR
jgi:ATP-dependent helicase/nuclease subunit B